MWEYPIICLVSVIGALVFVWLLSGLSLIASWFADDEEVGVYDLVNTPAAKAARAEKREQKREQWERAQELSRPIRSRLRDAFGREGE